MSPARFPTPESHPPGSKPSALTDPCLLPPQSKPFGAPRRLPLRPALAGLNTNVPQPPKHLQRWLSSSSDSEGDSDDGGRQEQVPRPMLPPPQPSAAANLAAHTTLMRKLGIKEGGWDSDSSFFSSPEPLVRAKSSGPVGLSPLGSGAYPDPASGTMAALHQELNAARQQADSASAELREADLQCRALQVGMLPAACCPYSPPRTRMVHAWLLVCCPPSTTVPCNPANRSLYVMHFSAMLAVQARVAQLEQELAVKGEQLSPAENHPQTGALALTDAAQQWQLLQEQNEALRSQLAAREADASTWREQAAVLAALQASAGSAEAAAAAAEGARCDTEAARALVSQAQQSVAALEQEALAKDAALAMMEQQLLEVQAERAALLAGSQQAQQAAATSQALAGELQQEVARLTSHLQQARSEAGQLAEVRQQLAQAQGVTEAQAAKIAELHTQLETSSHDG